MAKYIVTYKLKNSVDDVVKSYKKMVDADNMLKAIKLVQDKLMYGEDMDDYANYQRETYQNIVARNPETDGIIDYYDDFTVREYCQSAIYTFAYVFDCMRECETLALCHTSNENDDVVDAEIEAENDEYYRYEQMCRDYLDSRYADLYE